ncbi:hypothetical protein ACFP2T_16280 [Plantactinospora solaniradicis]|uniref:Uncharacterized protein n=1 Tax=Plantactinospora solaniradicis TaxID=1723736 RepID=A0ABW1K823_9ACTN
MTDSKTPQQTADQAVADLKALLSKPAQSAEPNPYDPRQPRLHSVRKPLVDLGDVASGRVPLPPTGGDQR